MTKTLNHAKSKKQPYFKRLFADMKKNYILYILMLPVVIYFITFAYVPLYGIQLAFKDFSPSAGFFGSEWIGFEHFERFFDSFRFWTLLQNTIGISIYGILVGFPIPIIFALFLNYLPGIRMRKTLQMVSYAPNFISTVVMCGMITIFLTPETGIINQLLMSLGFDSVPFLSVPEYFKSIYVWSGVWQGMGFSSIIYIAALAGVDQEMHEAAVIDGATKIKRILHIDLPTIAPTMIILLVLQFGGIMSVGFEKIFLLQNPLNMTSSDVISTYVYRVGLLDADYGYSTAVGLFNSVINVILLVSVNKITKKLTSTSLW